MTFKFIHASQCVIAETLTLSQPQLICSELLARWRFQRHVGHGEINKAKLIIQNS